MKHEKIFEYTTVWMDTLRNGKTSLVNTNKLVRFYAGATGLKTGTTNKAGSCMSATAKKDGLHLIAVIMGCKTSDERNAEARKLLEYGFANFALFSPKLDELKIEPVKVLGGELSHITPKTDNPVPVIIKKGRQKDVETTVEMQPDVNAPVEKGQVLGKITVSLDGKEIGSYPIKATESVQKMTLGRAFIILLKALSNLK